MKNINDQIIRSLFPDKSRKFTGYWNIVNKLIDEGKCISTILAYDINYEKVDEYIHIEPYTEGTDLTEIFLDKDAIMKSNIFKEAKLKLIEVCNNDISDMENKLCELKLTLNELLKS